jgi:pimeloyl-ACP methyl ester carboxylesterase
LRILGLGPSRRKRQATITAKDGTNIFYNDWNGQMLFFGQRGYRVTAHDRRGHGRSDQTWDGNEMDSYADGLAALFEKLDLQSWWGTRPVVAKLRVTWAATAPNVLPKRH